MFFSLSSWVCTFFCCYVFIFNSILVEVFFLFHQLTTSFQMQFYFFKLNMQFAWAFWWNLIEKTIFKCFQINDWKSQIRVLLAKICCRYWKCKMQNSNCANFVCTILFDAKICSIRTHTHTHSLVHSLNCVSNCLKIVCVLRNFVINLVNRLTMVWYEEAFAIQNIIYLIHCCMHTHTPIHARAHIYSQRWIRIRKMSTITQSTHPQY